MSHSLRRRRGTEVVTSFELGSGTSETTQRIRKYAGAVDVESGVLLRKQFTNKRKLGLFCIKQKKGKRVLVIPSKPLQAQLRTYLHVIGNPVLIFAQQYAKRKVYRFL
ncbi:uncharacterized protein LOC119562619 isoform X9 [Drosophila subpulchrella]|uniref:uncharacterized protein LOC119562619 isoform X9 n=1 Tax=Drosophila subpulchrella TaxID=1486046 RepID=UPI0018A12C2B|nr:uncharacterized protein LOC119562619 isoform X9 [Drosophila subpulchrella]